MSGNLKDNVLKYVLATPCSLLIFCLFSFASPTLAQRTTVSGRVLAEQDQSPLIGATILEVGTTHGTTTDLDGNFEFAVAVDSHLEISYLGFVSQTIALPARDTDEPLVILLKTDTTQLPISYVYGNNPIEPTIPAPILTLHPEDLNRDAPLAITPALNRVPGVLMQNGTLSTNRITIRGIGNRNPFGTAKIRAYLDDIPLTSGVGETTLEDIDLSIIHRVQVRKGPTGSAYGAGLGGMIHLQTENNTRNSYNCASVSGLVASYGTWRSVARIAVGSDDDAAELKSNHWRLDASANHTQSDGYRANNRYARSGANVLARVNSDAGHRTSLLLNFNKVKAFIPSSLNRADYVENPRQAAFTWGRVRGFEDYQKALLGVSHRRYLYVADGEPILQNTTSLFGNYRKNDESRPFNILQEDNLAWGGRTHFIWSLFAAAPERVKLHFGTEIFREHYDWQTYETDNGRRDTLLSDQEEQRRYANIFAEAQVQLNTAWRLEVGLNYNHTSYQLTDLFFKDQQDQSGDYGFSPIWSPRVGLLYTFRPNLSLFAVASHGFSPPTLEETLAPSGAINPDIQPEQGWNFELGSRGKHVNGKLSYELTVYTMRIKDLLVARRTALDQFVGVNAGKTVHNGFEGYVLYQATGRFHLFANYTYSDYRFEDFVDAEADYSGNELTGTPPHQFNAGVDYNLYGLKWYGHLNFRFVDELPLRDDNSIYSESYQTVNLRWGYRAHTKLAHYDIYFGINNLLDEKYASMFQINAGSFGGSAPRYYYPGLPRNFYVGFSISLRSTRNDNSISLR